MNGITLEEHLALHAEADKMGAAAAKATVPYSKKERKEPKKEVVLDIDSPMDFGKHKGTVVRNLIHKQPGYMKWVIEKTDRKFSGAVIAKMKQERII